MFVRFLRGAACAATFACAGVASAATIVIVPNDGPNEGFNDPTVVSPEGGNTGTTRGQQRLNLFQAAANIWAAQITSNVTIRVRAQFNPLSPCTTAGGVLGGAGPVTVARDFPNAPRANTWYPIALASALAGSDQAPGADDIDAEFNSSVDNGCLGAGTRFWYGTTSPAPNGNFVNLMPTLLHEIGHGLGFISLVCVEPGGCGSGFPQGSLFNGANDVWNFFLAGSSNPSLKWSSMTNAQRATLMTSEPAGASKLVWTGTNVTTALSGFITNGTTAGFLRMYAPGSIEPGSSVSHFTTAASPNLLMEPAITSTIFNGTDLTVPLFRDIGWSASGGAAPNQAPSISAPISISVVEDSPTAISGITFADPDAGNSAVTASFAVPTGTLSAAAVAGVTIANITNGKSLTGSRVSLNNYVAAGHLTYTTATNAQGTVTLAVGINDNGNTGVGGSLTASTNVSLQIQATNDAPTLNAPATIAVVEDVASALTGVTGADVDAGSVPVQLTFAVPSGTIAATSGGGVTASGTASSRILTGSIANINAFVAAGNVKFLTPPDSTANVMLSLTLNDNGNSGAGGPRTASATVVLQPNGANDAPVVTAPAQIATAISGSAPLGGITLADVDAGASNVSLQLAAGGGTLTAANGGGVTVAGSGTGNVTLTGTVAAIGAYLVATPPQYTGTGGTLSLLANDGGNSGTGGAQTGSATSQLVPTFLFRNGFE